MARKGVSPAATEQAVCGVRSLGLSGQREKAPPAICPARVPRGNPPQCAISLPMGFPAIRPRRLRTSAAMRALVRETTLTPERLVLPLFFHAGIDEPRPIETMPGVSQIPVKLAAQVAKTCASRGLGGVILFGLPKSKDPRGESGCAPDGPVPRAVAEMKAAAPTPAMPRMTTPNPAPRRVPMGRFFREATTVSFQGS